MNSLGKLLIFLTILVIFTGVVSAVDVTTDQVVNASGNLNSYVETNHSLPSSVNVSGSQVNTAQYLYISNKAVLNINSNSNSSINSNSYNLPSNPSEDIHAGYMGKSEYLQIANDIKNYMDGSGCAPNYAYQTSLGTHMRFETLVYMYSQILNSYRINGVLPDLVAVNQWSVVTNINSKFFTMDQIINSSDMVRSHVEVNHALPSTVNISGTQINMAQFLKLSTTTLLNINGQLSVSILSKTFNNPTNPSEDIHAGYMGKSEYLQIANDIKNYMDGSGCAPNYAYQTSLGTHMRFETLVYVYSQILNSYKINGILPDLITVNQWSVVANANTNFFAMDQITNASSMVNAYVEANHTLPSTVSISGTQINMAQFLKLSTTTLLNINGHLSVSILSNTFNNPTNPSEDIHAGNMGKSEYLQIANDIKNYMDGSGCAPNYAYQTSLGTHMRFETLVYMYSQILSQYNINQTLPLNFSVIPWLALNPNGAYNIRTNKLFGTIQAAIDDVDTISGDTITVGEGNYLENVLIYKPLKLISAYGVVAVQAADSSLPVFTVISNGSTIQGFTIKGSTDYGILLYEVNNCNINGNSITNSSVGIYVYISNNTRITGNNLTKNTENGIYIDNSNDNLIFQNNVTNNGHNGICTNYSNNNTISGNNASFNGLNGISLGYANNNTLSGNNATNNTNHGIYFYQTNNNSASVNNATNNAFSGICIGNSNNTTLIGNNATDNDQVGIFLAYSNSTLISGSNVRNNGMNGTLYGGIIVNYSSNITISANNVTNNTENGIYLYNTNSTAISENNAISNIHGIMLENAISSTLSMNNATDNILNGIVLLYSTNNIISGNKIKNNHNVGIYVDNSESTKITENTITNNQKGIYLCFSPATVNFNRIAENTLGGLFNEFSNFVNATNNWWGSNNPTVSSSNSSDICILGGNVVYSQWIVLGVNSIRVSDGISNITADLTYNNDGTDTLSLGHVPDGMTVNFTTDFGTIQQTGLTINGKAISQLSYNAPHNTVNVTVNLDNQMISKTVNLFKVYNTGTQEGFTTIQAALNDSSTSNGDIIEVANGIYNENIVLNKSLTLTAADGSSPIINGSITINSGGSNSIIQGFTVKGIYINSSNNNTISNNIISNQTGISIYNSNYNKILNNTISQNTGNGISIQFGYNNIISGNKITYNTDGISINRSYNNTVYSNTISNNTGCGINIFDYSGYANYINFNKIVGNGLYGLYVEEGLINATHNWWGTNNLTESLSGPSDIAIEFGTVYYDPYLVLNLTANPMATNNNSTITADFTQDNNGNDTFPQGHIPDGIPVNFTTNLGTITSLAYTKNGKAILTFKTGTTTSGIANITTTVDMQSIQLNITVDTIAPTVNATLDSGLYTTTQYVNLTAGDNLDLHPIIYYTTNGSTPTVSSTIYAAPIVITTTTTLKFMAVDFTGNQSPVGTLYYIFASIGNLNTGIGYSSIQNAINDNLTLDGHVIIVGNGTYTENILVNKNLTLIPYDDNVTIQAANLNNPVITINSGGSESVISGFTLTGATGMSSSGIYLNQASNCTIAGNTLTNNYYGLILTSSQDNMIWDNNLTGNLMDAIRLNSSNNNTIYSNTIQNNNGTGIYLANSLYTLIMANTIQNNIMNGIELNTSNNATIYENTITTNQQSGIKATSSSADINFNIITGNTAYGLYNLGNGTVNATNNWWGTNNLTVSSASPSNIYIAGGAVTYDPWLVLGLTGSTITVTHNGTSDSEITADLTHDNHGGDTSGSGSIPDGLPVNFTTTLGAINSTATVRSGKAKVTLTSSPSSGATTVTATLGNYSVLKMFHKSFSTIQAAVSDPLTVDGDVILVTNGTYTENIVINKNLTVVSGGNVTVQASNPSSPVFTVNNCSGVIIYGFTVFGATDSSAIYLNTVNNCQILSNTITGNGVQLVNVTSAFGYGIFLNSANNCTISGNILQNNLGGIDLEYSNNTLVSGNNVTGSTFRGVYLYQANNTTITESSLVSNDCGILSSYSNNLKVSGNDIKNNTYQGIYLYYSSGDLHFNRIVGNGQYGLLSRGGTVNATNNWWGTNNPVVSSVQPSAIYVISGSVLYNPRLVLTITPTSYKVADGKVYEATITADLNHNSNNEDLSTVIYPPEGMPVTFTSNNNSTITSTSYTEDGKASATLILNLNLQSGFTNVTATLDSQSASTSVDRVAKATIVVYSLTALDVNNPTQNLGLIYDVPLNESVSWVSVLWKSTSSDFGSFTNEVDLIVNGVVVRSQTVINPYYYYNKNNYSDKVWYNVNFLNWLFSESSESKMALQSYIELYPGLQNLTGTALETGILNITQQINGFNSSEMNVLAHHNYFKDNITTYITYPGDAAKKISFEDPDTNQTTGLTFSGNPIYRESTMIYANGGYYHTYGDDPLNPTSILYKDAGYEGVRSFAIVTTRVTDEILQYWLDQKDKTGSNGTLLYANGPMKAAYGTFLTSLMMIKCHDMIADQAAAQYNVIWSRTTPIIVSVFDDAYRTVMTLECDHRFGMDVTGVAQNVTAFRYACSSAINPLEHYVMVTLFPGGNGTSIVMGLGKEIINGLMPSMFTSNGYMVMISSNNSLFLILDPETGILRDIMTPNGTVSGEWCFSDLQAEWAFDLGKSMLNFGQNIMNILTNGGGIIDFSQLTTNVKMGLTGFINSALISLGISDLFMGIQNDFTVMHNLYNNRDIVFSMFGTCMMNAISVRSENAGDIMSPHTVNIKCLNDGQILTGSIRVNPNTALDAILFQAGMASLELGAISGVTEGIGIASALGFGLGVSIEVISIIRGKLNSINEDPWLQVEINGKKVYIKRLVDLDPEIPANYYLIYSK